MKLDYDLLRDILLYVEERSNGHRRFYVREIVPVLGEEHAQEIIYTMNYLLEAGYAYGIGPRFNNPIIIDLTNKGREFVDATNDNSIWQKTKDKIGDEISSKGAGFIIDTAIAIGRSIFNHIS